MNTPPSIASVGSVDVSENTVLVHSVVADDVDGDDLTFSIAAGADHARFQIDVDSGEIRFRSPPDYEKPEDIDGDNAYQFKVVVSDGLSEATQDLTVNVTDVTDLYDSCRRTIENRISQYWSKLSNWSAIPHVAFIDYSSDLLKASFDLADIGGSRKYIERGVHLKRNHSYAFRVSVSGITGSFGEHNFILLGGSDADFAGNRSVTFEHDGDYGIAFEYLSADADFTLRIGIGVAQADVVAEGSGNAGFTIQDIMWEELSPGDAVPGEYVSSMSRWCFDVDRQTVFDSDTGRITRRDADVYDEKYKSVWAITADSFGDDANDFPQQLLDKTGGEFAYYVEAVPGRQIAVAQDSLQALILLQNFPQGLASPFGVVVQGGVNDILSGATFDELQQSMSNMLDIAAALNKKAIVLTVPPFKNFSSWDTSKEIVRVNYNQWLIDSQTGNDNVYVIDLAAPKSAGGLASDSSLGLLDMTYDVGDGVHPNTTGSAVIADRVIEAIDIFR